MQLTCSGVGASGAGQRHDLAAAERLRPVPPTPPIVVITVTRKATAQALVHYRGNRYSLPPELAGVTVTVTHRAGGTTLAVLTGNEVTVAVHPRRADGTGATGDAPLPKTLVASERA